MASIAPGATVEGRFVIEKIAGAGGMGRVFRGLDLECDRVVAVKVVADGLHDELDRFRREAELLAQIRHPGLGVYVAHGTWEGTPYLVQEWIEGATLTDYLATTGCTVREAVALARALAEALVALHMKGIIHRDIKPGNIILEHREISRPRLVDFGVARRIDDAVSHSLTRTGSMLGTPGYTSPEQVRGKKQLGPPTDLFALGAIMYECVTGMAAFAGINALARNTKVVMLDPPAIASYAPETPRDVIACVQRLLRKDPADRYQTAEELLAELPELGGLPDDHRRRRGWHEGMATARPAGLGPRKPPAMTIDLPTGDQVACAILAVPAPTTTRDWVSSGDPSSAFSAIARNYGMRVEVHEDGSVTAFGSGQDMAATVGNAASCALALATK
ncbi:MAG TPA: serine/threonine-protein kinase, partial [Kofleriaceae bacterium]|nr:serine/threonine-protein kinase [Kofleriaceae bacterium]